MSGTKLLAEWFWTDRWDGSSATLLPIEHRGLYREMLTQAWRRGGKLPNDHEAIRRACRVTPQEWKRCWPKVSAYWRVDGDALVNDTQLAVYAEAAAMQQAKSDAGKKGNAMRWGNTSHRDRTAIAKRLAQRLAPDTVCDSPPSPSLSPKDQKPKSTDAPRRPSRVEEGTFAQLCLTMRDAINHAIEADHDDSYANAADYFKSYCAVRGLAYQDARQITAVYDAVQAARTKEQQRRQAV